MNTDTVLDAIDHQVEWDRVVAGLPFADVHFTSAYGRIAQRLGGRAKLFVSASGRHVKPFLLRENGQLEANSPFQYGGPTATEVTDSFERWARKEGVAREYCCLHPLMCVTHSWEKIKPVVVIDLENLESGLSRRIRRQLGEPVICREYHDPHRFHELYERAMNSKNAALHWRRPLDYFAAYDDSVNAFFFFAENPEGERALLTIGDGSIAYAHYLGGDGPGMGIDANLYYRAALTMRELGFRYFHLGGGRSDSPDDFLLFFKSGFSPLRWNARRYFGVYQ